MNKTKIVIAKGLSGRKYIKVQNHYVNDEKHICLGSIIGDSKSYEGGWLDANYIEDIYTLTEEDMIEVIDLIFKLAAAGSLKEIESLKARIKEIESSL